MVGIEAPGAGFETGDEIQIGNVPLNIKLDTHLGTTHYTVEIVNVASGYKFKIVDRPTPKTGWTLKGKLIAVMSSDGVNAINAEIYNITDSSQVVGIQSGAVVIDKPETLMSAAFTLPAVIKECDLRIWNEGAMNTTTIWGAIISLIEVKD